MSRHYIILKEKEGVQILRSKLTGAKIYTFNGRIMKVVA